jgi:hypothetical protein
MLGRARTTTFLEDEPELAAIGDAPIGELQDMARCPGEVVDAGSSKQPADRTVESEGPIG